MENKPISERSSLEPGASYFSEEPRERFDLEFFREARLFLGKNRATLTFYAKDEVASIHFDRDRGEIFYKGHNVKNMTLTEEQWLFLQKFGEFLPEDMDDGVLKKSYQSCLEQLIQQKI